MMEKNNTIIEKRSRFHNLADGIKWDTAIIYEIMQPEIIGAIEIKTY